jgi:hypothetical protein
VTATDTNNDGKADLVFGSGDGGAPRLRVVDGAELARFGAPLLALADGFLGGDTLSRNGVRFQVIAPTNANEAPSFAVSNVATNETFTFATNDLTSLTDLFTTTHFTTVLDTFAPFVG